MPGDDYLAVVPSAIKLKGQDAKVKKKSKKRKSTLKTSAVVDGGKSSENPAKTHGLHEKSNPNDNVQDQTMGTEKAVEANLTSPDDLQKTMHQGKTEAEIRHQERRRKMLDDRLRREGHKTHVERVEALNKYLSNLSEHHDIIWLWLHIHKTMDKDLKRRLLSGYRANADAIRPRIGPG